MDSSESGPPEDPRGDFAQLQKLYSKVVAQIGDAKIKKFLDFLLIQDRETCEKFFTAPGARSENPGHHSFKGGLAYHSLTAAQLGAQISDHYISLGMSVNRDIVIAGVILHDVGKAFCYKWEDSSSGYVHTPENIQFHHIPMGFHHFMRQAEIYNSCGYTHALSEKTVADLGHIILSHHGRRSWSSPVIPQTIEAYIVHIVEMMDAFVDKYNKGCRIRDIYDH